MNQNNIKNILTFISESVEKSAQEWKEDKPKLEKPFSKVSDTGSPEMKDAKGNYSKVNQTTAAKKIPTKPAFSSIKDPGSNGGATGIKGSGKPKEVKLESKGNITKESKKCPHCNKEINEAFGGSDNTPKSEYVITYKDEKKKPETKKLSATEFEKMKKDVKVKSVKHKAVAKAQEKKSLKESMQLNFQDLENDITEYIIKNLPANLNRKKIIKDLITLISENSYDEIDECLTEDDDMNLEEDTRAEREFKGENPALREVEKIEEGILSKVDRKKVKELREAIEKATGKKVIYK